MRAVREPCTHRVRGASRAAAGSGRSKSGSPWWSTTVSRRPRPSTQAGTRAALWGLTGALVRSPAPRADGAGSVLEVGVVLWRRRDRRWSPEPQTARPWGRFRSYYDVLRSPWSRRPTVSPDHGVAGRPSRAVRSCGRLGVINPRTRLIRGFRTAARPPSRLRRRPPPTWSGDLPKWYSQPCLPTP